MMDNIIAATCACGKVEMEATGASIMTGICYCNDCQAGGRMIEALPNAPKVLNDDGGSDYILHRKSRTQIVKGAELLKPLKLRQGSGTNRVIATCCNFGVNLNFGRGMGWFNSTVIASAGAPGRRKRWWVQKKRAGARAPAQRRAQLSGALPAFHRQNGPRSAGDAGRLLTTPPRRWCGGCS